ncbi:MAG: NmrA family NAD(P)-binding protein, partial [Anaerolineae bacterium]
MTTCLVIGATGFIGGQIARAAAERGWQVRALRRRP